MENKIKEAMDNYGSKGNCAQAVLYAFENELAMSNETLKALGMGFGGGSGGTLKGTCGALNGAILVFNLLNQNMSKADAYAHTKRIIERFEEKNKSIICGDLKGVKTRMPLVSCVECVGDATKLLIDELESLK